VCKLRHSLYDVKEAPQAWYTKFAYTLLDFDFLKSKYDASLFLRTTANGVVFLLVYVDDIVMKDLRTTANGVVFLLVYVDDIVMSTDLTLIDQLK